MADNIDYDDLSDKTISQIKETVEEEDVDLQKLLDTEKQNKDRKTLKSWLENRLEEQDDGEQETVDETDEDVDTLDLDDQDHNHETKKGVIGRLLGKVRGWSIPKAFLVGLVIGGLFTAAFSGGGAPGQSTAPGDTMSQAEVKDSIQPYVDQLSSQYTQILGSEPEITHLDSGQAEFANLYKYTYEISVANPNSTEDMTQEFDLYASMTGSHVLQAQALNQQQDTGQIPQ